MPDQSPETRLASYGSLAPGRVNHHKLDGLTGHWQRGTVKGRLTEGGWGSALGYHALVLDPQGDEIEVFVFESPDLPDHWGRLDQFEGNAYRRVAARIMMPDGECDAYIYVLNS